MDRKQAPSDAARTRKTDLPDRAKEELSQHHALRRWQIGLTSVVLAAILAGTGIILLGELPAPSGAAAGTVNCPLRITIDSKPYPGSPGDVAPWSIVKSGSDRDSPEILVKPDTDEHSPGSSSPSCALSIVKIPGKTLAGIEWRIGRTLTDPSLARGKTADISFMLKANRPITFDAASISSDDGIQVRSTAVPYIYQEWKKFSLAYKVANNATTFEVWLRLDLASNISAVGVVYMSDVRVDFK